MRSAREAAGLTQSAAGALVHTTYRVWRQWEAIAGDDRRRMHPTFWELFRLKQKNPSLAEFMPHNPTPVEVRSAREAAGLTQTAAGVLVHSTCNAWQQWEAAATERRHRHMHPAFWELFQIKISESHAI